MPIVYVDYYRMIQSTRVHACLTAVLNNVCVQVYTYCILCVKIVTYCRLGFDYEILMIVNCEFSETCNQKNRKVSLSVLQWNL